MRKTYLIIRTFVIEFTLSEFLFRLYFGIIPNHHSLRDRSRAPLSPKAKALRPRTR